MPFEANQESGRIRVCPLPFTGSAAEAASARRSATPARLFGLPVHNDGRESQKSAESREFGQWLGELTGLPVDYFDERYTSAHAEALLTAANIYIPIGAPLRWSMVRGAVDGFAANAWAWHPLPDMATIPR